MKTLVTSLALVLVLAAIGAADALFMERETTRSLFASRGTPALEQPGNPVREPTVGSSGSVGLPPPPVEGEGTSSVPTDEVPPPTSAEETPPPIPEEPSPAEIGGASSFPGVRRKSGPDVLLIVQGLGLEAQTSDPESLLTQVVAPEEISAVVLLKDGDRAGMLAWRSAPTVKEELIALKDKLQSSFSPALTDLLDEVQRPVDRPPRNFLTFFDPAISEERVVIIRVRDRLYEVRIREGREQDMFALIDALSQ